MVRIVLPDGGKELSLSKEAALLSGVFKEMMDEEEEEEEVIPLNEIDRTTMLYVLKWLEHYKDHFWEEMDKPSKSTNPEEVFSEDPFARDFFSMDKKEVVRVAKLMSAANLLGVESLLDASCWRFSAWLEETPEWEIHRVFGPSAKPTEEMVRKAYEDHPWLQKYCCPSSRGS